jgi:CheY-like chemotaxis protein
MSAKPSRILIAEDLDENRIALKLMLKLAGFEPLEACDGEQAIEIVRRERPDLVLMDISLPIIDGLQATRELRADARLGQLPIIIVSAYDNPQADRIRSIERDDREVSETKSNHRTLRQVQPW